MRTERALCVLGLLLFVAGCEPASGWLHVETDGAELAGGFRVEASDPGGVVTEHVGTFDGRGVTAADLELPEGRFDVVLTFTDEDGEPREACRPAMAKVTVLANGVTGLHLVPDCRLPDSGVRIPPAGPRLVGFEIAGARQTCELLRVRALTQYHGPEPLTWSWAVTSAPEKAVFATRSNPGRLEFVTRSPGAYELTVKVCAVGKGGGCAERSVPVRIRLRDDRDGDGLGDCVGP